MALLRSLCELTDLVLVQGAKVTAARVTSSAATRRHSLELSEAAGRCCSLTIISRPMSTHQSLRTASSAQRAPTVSEIQSSIQDHIDPSSGVVKTKKFVVTADELDKLIEAGPGRVKLVDVREPKEVEETGLLPRAINIPLTSLKCALQLEPQMFELEFGMTKPTRDDPVPLVFYARSAVKSSTALEIAYKLGLKKSRHYPGGWEEWSTRNQPGL